MRLTEKFKRALNRCAVQYCPSRKTAARRHPPTPAPASIMSAAAASATRGTPRRLPAARGPSSAPPLPLTASKPPDLRIVAMPATTACASRRMLAPGAAAGRHEAPHIDGLAVRQHMASFFERLLLTFSPVVHMLPMQALHPTTQTPQCVSVIWSSPQKTTLDYKKSTWRKVCSYKL